MEIKQEKSLPELLQEVRYKLTQAGIKKSGFNDHLKFNYVELADFEPLTIELFYERGITPVFWIDIDNSGIEYAHMMLYKGVESLEIAKFPTAEVAMPNPIQGLGGKITYCRRYAYQIGLCLSVKDTVDSMAEPPKANLITNEQWVLLNKLYTKEEVKAMYSEAGITNGKMMPREFASKKIADRSVKDEDMPEKKFY